MMMMMMEGRHYLKTPCSHTIVHHTLCWSNATVGRQVLYLFSSSPSFFLPQRAIKMIAARAAIKLAKRNNILNNTVNIFIMQFCIFRGESAYYDQHCVYKKSQNMNCISTDSPCPAILQYCTRTVEDITYLPVAPLFSLLWCMVYCVCLHTTKPFSHHQRYTVHWQHGRWWCYKGLRHTVHWQRYCQTRTV